VDGELHMKKYQKLRLVGEGSYSKCYLVKTSNSDSTYVIKIIPKKKL
jgi:serine/threonine protein kinase